MVRSCPFSVEIFPVQSAAMSARQAAAIAQLVALTPEFISVTYGAGGCTRDASLHALRLVRFSEAHGVEIPSWIRRRVAGFGDDAASIRAFGLEVVHRLCERLVGLDVPGIHFFSLNDAGRVADIRHRLRHEAAFAGA